jgi:hypothetical protein
MKNKNKKKWWGMAHMVKVPVCQMGGTKWTLQDWPLEVNIFLFQSKSLNGYVDHVKCSWFFSTLVWRPYCLV